MSPSKRNSNGIVVDPPMKKVEIDKLLDPKASSSSFTTLDFPSILTHGPESLLDDVSSSSSLPSLLPPPLTSDDDDDDSGEWQEDSFEFYNSIFDLAFARNSLAKKLNVASPNPIKSSSSSLPPPKPIIVGHRGALYLEPENTIPSFQTAARVGCDAIELDVFLLKCGTLAVFHGDGGDANPGELTNYCRNIATTHNGSSAGGSSIRDYTAEQVKNDIRLNSNFPEFPCPKEKLVDARIPTLEEVLMTMKGTGVTVKIELKGPGTEIPVLELVERMGMVDQCSFASFCHERVRTIRELRPNRLCDGSYQYKTGCLFNGDVPSDFIEIARGVGASEVHLRYDLCTKERVRDIHEAGMSSMAWFRGARGMEKDLREKFVDLGKESREMYYTVLKTGVKALCVNKPDILSEMF